jgi:hypothetical protein
LAEILLRSRDEQVQVLRRSWFAVVTNGIAAQHDETHFSGYELRQQIFEVGV